VANNLLELINVMIISERLNSIGNKNQVMRCSLYEIMVRCGQCFRMFKAYFGLPFMLKPKSCLQWDVPCSLLYDLK